MNDDDIEYAVRDRPYTKSTFDEGVKAARAGDAYRNVYDHYALPTFWRGYFLGYQSVHRFGA